MFWAPEKVVSLIEVVMKMDPSPLCLRGIEAEVNGELKRITVIQPLERMPTDPTSLQYERETPQGRIISNIRKDPKSDKLIRELSLEPRKPSNGKEVIHLSGLTPEERDLLGPFNHISHESRPEVPRPKPRDFDDDF